MNAQHTPGPWEVWPNSQNGQLCISHHETQSNLQRAVCEVDRMDAANARLIAAAPDLLAALEAALKDLKALTAWDQTSAVSRQAHAAIAKATGND